MAKTISQLNGGTVVTSLDGTELLEAEKDGVSVPITAQGIADLAGGGGAAAYLVYTALLTQSGTDAPVATVLQNTLGGTVVWSYLSDGYYNGTLAGVFLSGKVICFASNSPFGSASAVVSCGRETDDKVGLSVSIGPDFTGGDNGIAQMSLEIRVYP